MENAEPRVDVEKKPLSRYENIASVSGREERVKASIELSKPLSPCDVSEVRPDVIESLPLGNSDETSSTEVCGRARVGSQSEGTS